MGNEINYKEKLIEIVIKEYEKGYTVPEIANKFDLTEPTIYHWFREKDINMRDVKGKELSKHRQELILEMFKKGFSAQEIAKLLNHKVETVKNYIIKGYMGEEPHKHQD